MKVHRRCQENRRTHIKYLTPNTASNETTTHHPTVTKPNAEPEPGPLPPATGHRSSPLRWVPTPAVATLQRPPAHAHHDARRGAEPPQLRGRAAELAGLGGDSAAGGGGQGPGESGVTELDVCVLWSDASGDGSRNPKKLPKLNWTSFEESMTPVLDPS